jgi:hypothetical protein
MNARYRARNESKLSTVEMVRSAVIPHCAIMLACDP